MTGHDDSSTRSWDAAADDARVTGVDGSARLIEVARTRAAAAGLEIDAGFVLRQFRSRWRPRTT